MEGYSSTGNLPGGLFIKNFGTRLRQHKVLEARGGGQADLKADGRQRHFCSLPGAELDAVAWDTTETSE